MYVFREEKQQADEEAEQETSVGDNLSHQRTQR